jgi:hypothetical protein
VLLAATIAAHGKAMAVPACTAADIIAADPGCPGGASPCEITKVFEVGDGCTLDFGSRAVTLAKTGGIQMAQFVVEIRAGSFTVAGGASVDGQGFQGGNLTVKTTGDIVVEPGPGNTGILMGGLDVGGSVTLMAGGNVVVDGAVKANRLGPEAFGGKISLAAGGDIVTGAQSVIDPRGGPQEGGAELFLTAGGRIDIGSVVDIGGDSVLMADAGSALMVGANLLANGGGDGGDAGDIFLRAGGDLEINGQIQCRGSSLGIGGGSGGEIGIDSMRGDVFIRSEVTTRSGAPDGDGGAVLIATDEDEGGSIEVSAPGGLLNAMGNGTESNAGEIRVGAGLDVTLGGRILASGGDSGGEITVTAGRHVTVNDEIDASARSAGGLAGTVGISAGDAMSGDVTIQGKIDVSGGACSVVCGAAGDVDVSACDLGIGFQGSIDATAPGIRGTGGSIFLVARRQLRIDGAIDATGATGGVNQFQHPQFVPPVIAPGRVLPAPLLSACADCAGVCAPFCTRLCDCGDDDVDPFEECDGSGSCASGAACGAPGSMFECTCLLTCGDGVLDPWEECEGTNFGGETCEMLRFPGGNLTCSDDCTIDTSTCDPSVCGDGTIGAGEVCEPEDLDGRTCELLGFGGGTLACAPGCTAFDDSGCVIGACGDGVHCFNAACTTGPGGGRESCDDGNTDDGDACRNDCSLAFCGDGVVCTQPDCSSGSGNGPEQCDDGNASDTDACRDCTEAACGDRLVCSGAGCTSGPANGPEECDGGACCLSDCAARRCNGTGACVPGFLCCPAGANCSDGNPCTTDGCNPGTGCTHVANQDACDDGNPCTVNDACSGGSCRPGAPLECDDGNPCTVDRCDPSHGCVSTLDFDACPVATVAGRKLTLKTKASNAQKNTLTLSLKGRFAPPAAAEVPTIAGASLRIRDAVGQDVTFDLPARSWKAKGSKFSYKDGKGQNGACTKAVFKAGKSIQATCKGERVRLGPSLLEPVQVILRTGNTFYCTAFGGKVSKNGDGTFIAKGAEAPAECAVALELPRQ